jgi:predicted nucleic acid-binding protein
MKIIISDTTALIILAKSNHLNLLTNIIDRVYIPKAVMCELQYKNDIVKVLVESSDFIEVQEVNNQEILCEVGGRI